MALKLLLLLLLSGFSRVRLCATPWTAARCSLWNQKISFMCPLLSIGVTQNEHVRTCWGHFSCVWLFATPWTAAHQAPLSMGFSMQGYWRGLPFPSPGNLSSPGIFYYIVYVACMMGFGILHSVQFISVHSLSRVRLFATPWIAARQASLSITVSWSLPKTHVHRVGDAIQPSHPLSSPSPPAPKPSQNQGLFQWVNSAWGGQRTS